MNSFHNRSLRIVTLLPTYPVYVDKLKVGLVIIKVRDP